jgi:hypothetical protein
MGTERQKPILLEGEEENGVKYVNLGDSFSTGIFLDQRHQRAWLAEICNENIELLCAYWCLQFRGCHVGSNGVRWILTGSGWTESTSADGAEWDT